VDLHLFLTLFLYSLPGLVIGFTLHELMHAVVSVRLGDNTPRRDGRLSLDPLVQIDPFGFAALVVIGFGFARPVVINTLRIRTPAQQALVAFAGPATNLALAALTGLVLRLVVAASPSITTPNLSFSDIGVLQFPYFGQGGGGFILFWVLYQTMYINALLFVFNMIPIPPLDGFKVFKGLFGRILPDLFAWMERNAQLLAVAGLIALFVLPRAGNNSAGNVLTSAVEQVVSTLYHGDTPPVPGFESLFNALSGR
jgi:Zn-dependent protease